MITKDKNTRMKDLHAVLWSLPIAIFVWVMIKPFIAILVFFFSVAALMNFDMSILKKESSPFLANQPEKNTQSLPSKTAKSTPRSKPKKIQTKAKVQSKTKAKTKSVKAKSKNITTDDLFAWPAIGGFDFELAEDGRYQDALAKLANGPAKAKKIVIANLVPENDNPEDDRSVRVDINDSTVGYLRRDNARSFRRRLSAKQLKDQITACQAIISSPPKRGTQNKIYNVLLDIKPFV